MIRQFIRKLRSLFHRRAFEIAPDEIFMDSHNLPQFDTYQMEGRIERPLSTRVILFLSLAFLGVGLLFLGQVFRVQFIHGDVYAERSKVNRLANISLFADRGVIIDRNGKHIAWNEPNPHTRNFSLRTYATTTGLAHVTGYVKYPQRDDKGVYYQTEFKGKSGVEHAYNSFLTGENGKKTIEINALRDVISENVVQDPIAGDDLELSIDKDLQHALFEEIRATAETYGYKGGAGVILDVETGEIIVLTSYPEYDIQALTDGDSEIIDATISDTREPFLNRAVQGLYTPGSTVKPYIAAAALNEDIIAPHEEIVSTGALRVPHPYFDDQETVFKDWKAHGAVDMRDALAVSSNVYFYQIGGGYEDQKGLGIETIADYMERFGFGQSTGVAFETENNGVVPTPAWKEEHFQDGQWRVGNTYHTSIGQFGFQITPLQAARAIAAVANGGTLLTPRITRQPIEGVSYEQTHVGIEDTHLNVVREGMRQAVTDGTAAGLYFSDLPLAAKTGTAEVGDTHSLIHSWVIGFFPYEDPQYAFAVVMERGPYSNTIGGVKVMRGFLDSVRNAHPEFYP